MTRARRHEAALHGRDNSVWTSDVTPRRRLSLIRQQAPATRSPRGRVFSVLTADLSAGPACNPGDAYLPLDHRAFTLLAGAQGLECVSAKTHKLTRICGAPLRERRPVRLPGCPEVGLVEDRAEHRSHNARWKSIQALSRPRRVPRWTQQTSSKAFRKVAMHRVHRVSRAELGAQAVRKRYGIHRCAPCRPLTRVACCRPVRSSAAKGGASGPLRLTMPAVASH